MEYRSIDGSGNAADGANTTGTAVGRIAPARFADDIGSMVTGPNPRTISNLVVGEGQADAPNGQGLSGFMYAWGQFIDHDMVRSRSDGVTDISVVVPLGDPDFPDGTLVAQTRNVIDPTSGTDAAHPRASLNFATGWLDGSVVYGATAAVANSLRTADGHMLVSAGDYLPIAGGMFLAGDPRAAENPSLTSLQTIFLREHNYQVDRLAAADPSLSGDALYQQARAIVGAEIAHITYDEFLPHLIGKGTIAAYTGFDPNADGRIGTEFAGAAWRWGHSTVSAETERTTETGATEGDPLELRDAFFIPAAQFTEGSGAAGFLRHLATDRAQAMDARIVEDLRNFLFDPPAAQDLAALNIQRGRDLGLPTLNGLRESLGLEKYTDFAQITDDAATVAGLRDAYASVDDIDLWTGGLSEALVPGTFLGQTFSAVVALQFTALRDGDRLWYESQGFDADTLQAIKHTSLGDLILRHTDTQHIQDDVFVFFERRDALTDAENPDAPQLVIGTGAGQILQGGAANDLLAGRARAQTLLGEGGDDTLNGGGGHDVLVGGTGRDRLLGGGGDDVLVGGAGQDVLRGGIGHDIFRFLNIADSAIGAADRIADFTHGEDRIDLSAIADFAWRGQGGFTHHGVAEARYLVRAENLLLQLDLDGDGHADAAIVVAGASSLVAADFIF